MHLLKKIQESKDDLLWNNDPDLLIWILHIGGSFSPKGTVRSEYKTILQITHASRLRERYNSFAELIQILEQFVWSERAFGAQFEEFWNEIQTV